MADGNLINPNDFDMFELDPSELAFQITFFAGFDDAPVKMKIVADRVIVISGRSSMIVRSNALVILALGWDKNGRSSTERARQRGQ